jgi:4-oxalocrotonate tautomerase
MPLVNIKIARTDAPANAAPKAELIQGATALLEQVLNKNPAAAFVIIEEVETENWGGAGKSLAAGNAKPKS